MAKVKDCPGFETFGADVKEARKAKNLARKDLAEKVNIDTRYLANIENEGTIPSLPVIIQLVADLTVRHPQKVGQQDHIPFALRQLRQSVGQKIAGHDDRETLHIKDMLVHEVLVPYDGLLQLGSCQLAQGFFLVPEAGIFTLDG